MLICCDLFELKIFLRLDSAIASRSIFDPIFFCKLFFLKDSEESSKDNSPLDLFEDKVLLLIGSDIESKSIFLEVLNAKELLLCCSDNLSRSLIERGGIEEAKKILLDIEPMAIEMNEVGFLPEIYIHLSEIARLEKRSADAIFYARNATEIVAADDQYSGPRSFSALAKAFIDVGERVHAENSMQIALRMIENTNYIYVKAIIIFDYAQFLLRTESKTDKVIQLCRQAKDIFSRIGSQWDLKKVILFEESADINDIP